MTYYLDFSVHKSNVSLKKLKELAEPKAKKLALELSAATFKSIKYEWTRKNTFGFIFLDFEFTRKKYERIIGPGEKDLFEKIKDDFYCLVLSRTLDRNFKILEFDSKKCIVINLNYFREFLSIIRDRSTTISLFLYKFSKKEEENLIRNWLRNYEKFEDIRKEAMVENIDIMIDVIRKHKIETPEDLDKLITLAKVSGERIKTQPDFFSSRLEEFRGYIESDINEDKIHDFIFNNIWLLDFQYMKYSKEMKEQLEVGEPDISLSLYKDEIGIERAVIIELKRPDAAIITEHYRGNKKPAILAGVGKALSQTIHYIEEKKKGGRVVKGIVLIGRHREVKDWFTLTFNQYLHGIEVLTYDEIYERAKNIVDVFRTTINSTTENSLTA